MKMWDARFSKEADKRLNDFNSSIHFDSRMYAQDIKGSIAHAKMLAKQGIIADTDFNSIETGLSAIKEDLENGQLEIDPDAEDIHMFIESELTRRVGDAGKRLHTARSRNDQVALDFRMYTIDECTKIKELLVTFIKTLCKKADANLETIMPGYTHLQRAQPVTFAHHLMAYVEMLMRDIERIDQCVERCKVLPLGSGALATSTYPIDREYVAKQLGFNSVSYNSLDGVSDRDFAIELAGDIALVMMHLSRLSEEVILWSSWEFKFIELDDAFATGSSIMPQKKNPDICELVRGKTGRTYGNLNTLLTMMKGLPLAYNKDMQEDKEALFDSIDTVKICLETIIPMIDTCTVYKDHMRLAAAKGFINATDCADYLTKKSMPFRDAYKTVGRLVAYCNANDKTFEDLSLAEFKQADTMFEQDIFEAIKLETCVKNRKVVGGPAPETVKNHITLILDKLKGIK